MAHEAISWLRHRPWTIVVVLVFASLAFTYQAHHHALGKVSANSAEIKVLATAADERSIENEKLLAKVEHLSRVTRRQQAEIRKTAFRADNLSRRIKRFLQGSRGLPGVPGVNGINGQPGVPGGIGPIGPIGPIGRPGATGPEGINGSDGATGPEGVVGPGGPPGPEGPTGPPGPEGPIGPPAL